MRFLAILFLVFALSQPAHADCVKYLLAVQNAVQTVFMKTRVHLNKFQTGRGLKKFRATALNPKYQTYDAVLTPRFTNEVYALRRGQHWIDVGAGEALAQRELLEDKKRKGELPPNATAISIRKPRNIPWEEIYGGMPIGGFQYVETDVVKYAKSGRQTADIVSDLFGAAHYTTNFSKVLEAEIRLLKVGGILYLSYPSQTSILTDRNEPVSVTSYIGLIKGIEVEALRLRENSEVILALRIKRTSKTISVPPLKLLSFESNTPPFREYLLK